MKLLFFPFLLTIIISSCTPETQNWTLSPYPNSVSVQPGSFTFDQGVDIIVTENRLKSPVHIFIDKLKQSGVPVDNKSKNKIIVELGALDNTSKEAYKLEVEKNKIIITASEPQGVFYGLMTVWQGLKFSEANSIPCGIIHDEPRFEYRGFMLDESRHFFGKEKVFQLLDLMSIFKLNAFHWHLTDSPGWRIEIKAFPKLTTIGGKGNHTNPDAPARYYTQGEIKEIVAYAADRFIIIIPEIDMPGHATAANKAYPEFSGGGSEEYPEFTFNPGKEETYAYLMAILKEVNDLFPSSYLHFGGDEVHFGNENWNNDEAIKSLMKRENLSRLKEVEHYFSHRMADSIKTLGKIVAGWDEVVQAGLGNDNTLVYWWRHDRPEQLQASLDGDYNIVLCPRRPLYFDFVQHDSHENGRRWDGFCPIQDVYHFPDSTRVFTAKESKLVKGIQANLWTERATTPQWIDFMTFPRMIALSEAAWTNDENKNYTRFEKFLPSFFNYLDELDIYYFNSLADTLRVEPAL